MKESTIVFRRIAAIYQVGRRYDGLPVALVAWELLVTFGNTVPHHAARPPSMVVSYHAGVISRWA